MLHLFVVLKVSSLIKKGLRGSLPANTDDSCLNLSIKVYAAPSCTKATMTLIHGRQAHVIQTIFSNLWCFRATVQIQVDNEDKQIKQNAM